MKKTTYNTIKAAGAAILLFAAPVTGAGDSGYDMQTDENSYVTVDAGSATPVSLSYDEYIGLVMSRNHGMIAERFRAPIAEQEIKAARVLPDPELAFEGAEEQYSIELGYTIEFGRKRGARIRYARTFAKMEQYDVELYAAELRLAAAEAFIKAVSEGEMLNLKRSSYRYMLELSSSDSIRFRAGEITENEARQSAVEANTLLGEVYQQEGEYLSAVTMLGYFSGISADTLLIPAGNVETGISHTPLARLIENGQANRIENELAVRAVELAQRELAIVRSERKPDVEVFIGYERNWKGVYNSRKMLKGGVTIPLQFSSINKGSLRAARFSVEQERRQEMNVRAEIETDIVQAYHIYNAALKTYEHFRSGVMEDALKVLEGAVYSYRAGETDILEVLIAQRTYNETREQFIESKKNAQTAAVNLQFACGQL